MTMRMDPANQRGAAYRRKSEIITAMGMAVTTAKMLANSVPTNMGVMLYSPAIGLHISSAKKRPTPICSIAMIDSRKTKSTINTVMVPQTTADPRVIALNSVELFERNKIVAFDDGFDVVRLSKVQKRFQLW